MSARAHEAERQPSTRRSRDERIKVNMGVGHKAEHGEGVKPFTGQNKYPLRTTVHVLYCTSNQINTPCLLPNVGDFYGTTISTDSYKSNSE